MIRSKYLKQFSLLTLAAFFMLATGSLAWAQKVISSGGTPVIETFDALANTGTANAFSNNVTILGVYSNQTVYRASTGSDTAGALYSFGAASPSTERALGSIASGGTGTVFYGIRYVNNTGSTINSITVSYTGEQWRNGGNTAVQSLTFDYLQAATVTSVTTGTFTAVPALNFSSLQNTATAGALNGNAVANRTTLTQTINVTIPAGQEIMIRWTDLNDAGNDHGLAVDDVSVTATTAPANTAPTITPTTGGITRQQGSPAINSTVATVSDTETAAGSLTVTAQTLPTGITVSNIINTNGTITADVAADCSAAVGANTVVLRVSDGTATTDANLTVNVTANTAPTLLYDDVSVALDGSTTNTPTTASDNGAVAYSVLSQGTFTGTVSVNNAGVVSISNAAPAGSHNIIIRATDGCGLTTDAGFVVIVNAPDTESPVIMYTPLTATNNTAEPERLIIANVTDNNDVAQVRIYYRKNEEAYVSEICGSDGGYYCYITYSDLGGIASGDTISYFIAAVDDAGNISSNPFGATGTDIANLTAPEETNLYAIGTTTVPAGNYSYISVNTATLEGSITVNRELNLNGIVTVPAGESVFVTCFATTSGASGSAYVIGSYAKQFCAFARPVGERGIVGEVFPVGTANGYSPVTVFVNSTAGAILDIAAKEAAHPNLDPATTLRRYWTINKFGGALDANLTFQYLDGDVAGNETNYKAIRIENGTAAFYTPFSLNAAANQFSVSGVTNFSDWTAGESLLAPTAAAVNVGGRVTESNGRGIQRVALTMTDSQGVVRTAYTNSMGFYRFEAVPAGETYVFSATHRRYRFEQPAQVRFISEDDANINFVSSIGGGLIDLTRPF